MSGCVSSEGRNHQRRLRIPQTDLYSSPRFPSNTFGLLEPLWNPFVKSSPRLDTQSQAYTATYVALLIYVELVRCGRCWYRSYYLLWCLPYVPVLFMCTCVCSSCAIPFLLQGAEAGGDTGRLCRALFTGSC